jgi:hypothetical protein
MPFLLNLAADYPVDCDRSTRCLLARGRNTREIALVRGAAVVNRSGPPLPDHQLDGRDGPIG